MKDKPNNEGGEPFGWNKIERLKENIGKIQENRQLVEDADYYLQRMQRIETGNPDESHETEATLGAARVALVNLYKDLFGVRLSDSSRDFARRNLEKSVQLQLGGLLDDYTRQEIERFLSRSSLAHQSPRESQELRRVIFTAIATIDNLLESDETELKRNQSTNLLEVVFDFVKSIYIDVIASGIAGYAVNESADTEMIKSAILLTAIGTGTWMRKEFKERFTPVDLRPKRNEIDSATKRTLDELCESMNAMPREAEFLEASVHKVLSAANEMTGLAYVGRRLAEATGDHTDHFEELLSIAYFVIDETQSFLNGFDNGARIIDVSCFDYIWQGVVDRISPKLLNWYENDGSAFGS